MQFVIIYVLIGIVSTLLAIATYRKRDWLGFTGNILLLIANVIGVITNV